MAASIPGLGFEDDIPRQSDNPPALDGLKLSPEAYFLLSRIDGRTSIQGLLRASGQSMEAGVRCLRDLYEKALIDLPNGGERPEIERWDTADLWPGWVIPRSQFTYDPADLEEDSEMPVEERKEVMYFHHHLERVTYYALLNVPQHASMADITRSYYRLSKRFHPDRWFRRNLGRIGEPLRAVFRWANKAFKTLSDSKRRREYDALLARGLLGPWQTTPKRSDSGSFKMVGKQRALGRDALVARARRLRGAGDHLQAAAILRRALALAESPDTSLELAAALADANTELDDALRRVRTVTSARAGNYAAMLLEARILRLRGQVADARRICQEIGKAESSFPGLAAELEALNVRVSSKPADER